jgi:hypothetical protein
MRQCIPSLQSQFQAIRAWSTTWSVDIRTVIGPVMLQTMSFRLIEPN